jgi:hypothetical protein
MLKNYVQTGTVTKGKKPHRRFVTETHIDFPLEISGS